MRRILMGTLAAAMLAACGGGSSSSSSGGGSSGATTTTTTSAGSTGGTTATTGAGSTGGGTTNGGSTGGTTATAQKPVFTQDFTATPNTLPAQGGDVTLTWEVSGADSLTLEPGLGDVTGLDSYTVPGLTQSTTYRLIATNAQGSTVQTALVTVSAPSTVTGTVVDEIGIPAPSVRVFIPGSSPTLTDATGKFSIAGVIPPYDLIIADNYGEYVEIFRQLSATDQVTATAIWLGSPPSVQTGTAYVVGKLSGYDAGDELDVDFSAPHGASGAAYALDPFYIGVTVTPEDGGVNGSVIALSYGYADAGDYSVVYHGMGRADDLQLTGGEITDAGTIALTAVSTAHTTFTTDLGVPTDGGFLYVESASLTFADGTAIALPGTRDYTPGSLAVPSPNANGATLSTFVTAVGLPPQEQECASGQYIAGAAVGSSKALTLAVPPLIISPFNGATAVGPNTLFAWAADTHADTGYVVNIGNGVLSASRVGSGPAAIIVATMQSQFRLPDLSAVGIQLPPDEELYMSVQALSPATTALELLPPALDAVPVSGARNASCDGVYFTTAP